MTEELFNLFWAKYPKKVAKGAARKAWVKLRPTPELLETILKALSWQVHQDQWQRDGGQFIPYPASYLNQERWSDEPFQSVNSGLFSEGELNARH